MLAPAQEWELELEGEWELEGEGEWELEGEMESEQFFRRLAALAGRALPALRRIGLQTARSALTGGGRQLGQEIGGAMGGTWAPRLADLGGDLGTWLGGKLPQQEFEFEFEGGAAVPNPRLTAALMEHIGHAATTARSDREAEAFFPALIPLATQLLPRIAPALMRAAPQLTSGLTGILRNLRSKPSTRPLVRTVPTIVGRTAQSLGRQADQGRPVTPQTAVRTLAQQTSRVLGNPQQAVQAYRRSRALDQQFHHLCGSPCGTPTPESYF